jgi:MFS family permease
MKKTVLLSLMMLLEFMMLPVWYIPLLPYVDRLPGGADWKLWCGMVMGFGTFTSPIVGMFADRFLNAERVLSICYFVTAAFLAAAFFVTSPALLFFLTFGVMCFYMPTWSLTATIAMANAPREAFPRIRVFGTVGWAASGLFAVVARNGFGLDGFDTTRWIFAAGAGVAVAGGLLAFALPATAPVAKGAPMSVADALGLKALVLLKRPQFLVFTLLLLLAMVPFQWYNVYGAQYLAESGFRYLTMTMNLGQVGEIGFVLLVPLVIRKFGFKWAMALGFSALAFRNAAFAVSSVHAAPALDIAAILVHGLIFGTIVVGGQMYADETAPKELRAQAQGFVNIITGGLGVFASNLLFDAILRGGSSSGGASAWTPAYVTALALALVAIPLTALFFQGRERQSASPVVV